MSEMFKILKKIRLKCDKNMTKFGMNKGVNQTI